MPVAPPQKNPRQPQPPVPPPSPVNPGQVAPGVQQQAPPPTPAPNGMNLPAQDMANPPQAPGQVAPPGVAGGGMDMRAANPAPATPPGVGMEPYGAQVLRRVHEDHSLIITDYDEMASMCENPAISEFLFTMLTGIDASLTAIEGLFASQYGQLPGIMGAMPVEAPPPGMTPPPGGMPPPGGPPTEGDVVDVPDEVAEEMIENGEAEEVSEDEGEGEKKKGPPPPKKKGEKAFRRHKDVDGEMTNAIGADSGRKSVCPKCGTSPCNCSISSMSGAKAMSSQSLLSSALQDHELDHAKETHDFLGELSNFDPSTHFGAEHRMKAFHFHKTMYRIGSGGGSGKKSVHTGGFTDGEGSGEKSIDPPTDNALDLIHPHRAACSNCSDYLGRISQQRHFGHRDKDEAGKHHGAMAMLFEALKEELQEEGTDEQDVTGNDGAPNEEALGEPKSKEDKMEGSADDEDAAMKALLDEREKAMDQMLKEMSSFAIA